MSVHAALKEAENSSVVGLLFELKLPAVLHKFAELARVTPAKLFKGSFNLLLFNVGVLFILRATRESLPGQFTLEEV